MIQKFVKQWDECKHLLEEKYKKEFPQSYESIFKDLFQIVIKDTHTFGDYDKWDFDRFRVIDDGVYQGDLIFLLCTDSYQPTMNDYIVCEVSYGSCSGCDTFERILSDGDWDSKIPSEHQTKEFMTLALHILQGTKILG